MGTTPRTRERVDPRPARQPLIRLVAALVTVLVAATTLTTAAVQTAAAADAPTAAAAAAAASSAVTPPSDCTSTTDMYNPCSYDATQIMNMIAHPPQADSVVVSSHRGLHALVNGKYPNVPENSLDAVLDTGRGGLAEIELDVKLTKDGVPVLSHDLTVGRATTYPSQRCDTDVCFDPFAPDSDATNKSYNPPIDSLTLQQLQQVRLRDSVTPNAGPVNNYYYSVVTLADAYDLLKAYHVQMAVALDIRTPAMARAALAVTAGKTDSNGRSMLDSVMFKIPFNATPSVELVQEMFPTNRSQVNYQPVFNTGDACALKNSNNGLCNGYDGAIDEAAGERNLVADFRNVEANAGVKIPAVEVQIKKYGANMQYLVDEVRHYGGSDQRRSLTVFSPFKDIDPSKHGLDPTKEPYFFKTDGTCCQRLPDFFFKGDSNFPSDTVDNRVNSDFLKREAFNGITSDDAETLAQRVDTTRRDIPRPTQPSPQLKVMTVGGKVVLGAGEGDGNAFRLGVKNRVKAGGVTDFDYVGSQHAGAMADNETEGYNQYIQQIGDRINCTVGQYRPNVVLFEMGTEDLEQKVDVPHALNRMRSALSITLQRAPETTMFVATLPPSATTGTQNRINSFNSQLRTEVAQQAQAGKRISLVDMSALTVSDLQSDGATPNTSGYDKMASAFSSAIAHAAAQGTIQAAQSGDTAHCGDLRPLDPLPGPTVGRTSIRQPDPSVIKVGSTYYSVAAAVDPDPNRADGYDRIVIRSAPTLETLDGAVPQLIWSDPGMGSIWAPEIQRIDGSYVVYFTAGNGTAHRMYAITSGDPMFGYSAEKKVDLPDDKWAIDGTSMTFGGQRYFVWSGWAGDTDVEQNLYIAKMTSITASTGGRAIISQPREGWERGASGTQVNEAPEAIKDPNGQLHIVYSANQSWTDQYCLADLRLEVGGDPMAVWDWYKSNGCLFGSNRANMMIGWDPTAYVNGPGHHTFVLPGGDINQSPAGTATFPTMYHGVPKGMTYNWQNRVQYIGGAAWQAQCTYSRANSPGEASNTGWSLKFFEDRTYGAGGTCAAASPGESAIRNQDPSVIRVGGTYYSVETDGTNIFSRSAGSIAALGNSPKTLIWSSPKNMPSIWAPELSKVASSGSTTYYGIYFASGASGTGQRMYYTQSTSPDHGFSDPVRMNLPDDKWAVDGTLVPFNNQLWFVWSGWDGDTNIEQNLYIAKMAPGSLTNTTGPRYIISQPREAWERTVGNPFINEAPEAIKDPNGQLHIVYSTNGSWSEQYCMAEIRLKAGGDPTNVWDWYKSNGCLFGSNQANMMPGWDATLYVNGPGHNSFVLLDGDINTSPPAGEKFPMEYHGVPKGTSYLWEHRVWYSGSFVWWGNTTYSRSVVPGDTSNTGWSLKFFE